MTKSIYRVGILLFLPYFIFAQTPNWVLKPPTTDKSFYRTVQSVPLSDKNHEKRARDSALEAIAFEIIANISGRNISEFMEVMDITTKNEFRGKFIVSTMAYFKGLEIVYYSDEKNYYVLVEYSKKKHLANVLQNKNRAIELFKDYRNLEPYDFNKKLEKLVQAFENIAFVYSEDVYVTIRGRQFNLLTEVPSEIRKMMNQVNTNSLDNYYKGVYGKKMDKELAFEITIHFPPPYVNAYGVKLPVEYYFMAGSGDFSLSETFSSQEGVVTTSIMKIKDRKPRQIVAARINLKNYKNTIFDSDYFDRRLEKFAEPSKIVFDIDVSTKVNERIAIFVQNSEGIPNDQIEHINTLFVDQIHRVGFEIISRSVIAPWLEQNGYTAADICNDASCRGSIARDLNVDKLILIDVKYIFSAKRLSVKINYNDPKKPEDIPLPTITEKINSASEILGIVEENVAQWVKNLDNILNKATLDFGSNDFKSVLLYIDGNFEYSLPNRFSLTPGDYKFEFQALGYENYKQIYTLGPNTEIESNIISSKKGKSPGDIYLKKKTGTNAFIRSMAFPGLGQFYSIDKNNPQRRSRGWTMVIGGAIAIAGTSYAWHSYNESLTRYNDTKSTYLNQTTMEGINEWNQKTLTDNKAMKNQHSFAITISSVTVAYWIGNAIEALINIPEY